MARSRSVPRDSPTPQSPQSRLSPTPSYGTSSASNTRTSPPRKSPFNIIDSEGKKVSAKEASSADGQRCLNNYFNRYGYFPNAFLTGRFVPSKKVKQAENDAVAARATSPTPSHSGKLNGNWKRRRSSSSSKFNDQNKIHRSSSVTSSPDEIQYDIPDFSEDLPPIPDIQKSFRQLEAEKLNGGVRPSYFGRDQWNKPISKSWEDIIRAEESSESEEDGDDQLKASRNTKLLAIVRAAGVSEVSFIDMSSLLT